MAKKYRGPEEFTEDELRREIGKTVFLTLEEAEKALEEYNG